jgi:hypothetical protein
MANMSRKKKESQLTLFPFAELTINGVIKIAAAASHGNTANVIPFQKFLAFFLKIIKAKLMVWPMDLSLLNTKS